MQLTCAFLLVVVSCALLWCAADPHDFRPLGIRRLVLACVAVLGAVAGVALAGGSFIAAAHASTAEPDAIYLLEQAGVLDLTPLLQAVVGIGGALLSVAGTWAISWIGARAKLDADSRVRDYLHEALDLAIQYATATALDAGRDTVQVDVRNQIIADAGTYAAARVPSALKHFGIDAGGLADMLRARLP
jgi:hypothetical protein